MRTQFAALLFGLGVSVAGVSCLPADDRPPPGSLLVTVSPSAAVSDGVTTSDGWAVSFERAIVAIGRVSLGDGCTEYGDARYDRIIDAKAGSGQKVSIQFALAQCSLGFRITAPNADSLLGAGVTESDKTIMRTPGTDAYATSAGISVMVRGAASKAGITKTFAWSFRVPLDYENCKVDVQGATEDGVNLHSHEAVVYDVQIAVERLLRDGIDEKTAQLRFGPFALADDQYGNGDGEVTLEELAKVELAGLGNANPYAAGDAGTEPVTTMSDYVYRVQLPAIARFRGEGSCELAKPDKGHHGPGMM